MKNTNSYGIFLLDNRIAERNIKQERLSKKDYDDFLSSLPDLIEECEEITPDVYGLEQSKVVVSGHFAQEEDRE